MRTIQELLKTRKVLLADGATGTNLKETFNLDLGKDVPWDVANVKSNDTRAVVTEHYKSYVNEQVDLVLTNTWAAHRYGLAGQREYLPRVFEINKVGAELLRKVVDESRREIICAGSIGPTYLNVGAKGELVEAEHEGELEDISYAAAFEAFDEQIAGLKAGGVDMVWIETMSLLSEIDAAVEAALRHGMPFACCMRLKESGVTWDGESLDSLADRMKTWPVRPEAFGANCGFGIEPTLKTLGNSQSIFTPEVAIIAKANCGPERHFEGEKVSIVSASDEAMASYARNAADLGVRVIGGCCGTLPKHIAAMRAALDEWAS